MQCGGVLSAPLRRTDEEEIDGIPRRYWLLFCQFWKPRQTEALVTPKLRHKYRHQDARTAKSMGLNLSVQLRSVATAFCPPSTQIGFIGRHKASSSWMRFR